jgi:hypothetical protein
LEGTDIEVPANVVTPGLLEELEKAGVKIGPPQPQSARKYREMMGTRYSLPSDAEYLSAVDHGDMEEAQKLVDQRAEEAGYTDKAYHGTRRFGFTEFNMKKGQGSIFVAYDKNLSQTYTRSGADVREINGQPTLAPLEDRSDDELFELSEKYLRSITDENGQKLKARVMYDWPKQSFVLKTHDGQFMSDWQSKYITRDELIDILKPVYKGLSNEGVYQLYTKPGNQLVVEAGYANWDDIDVDTPDGLVTMDTRGVAEYAKENGYDSVRINNVIDDGGKSGVGDDGVGDAASSERRFAVVVNRANA